MTKTLITTITILLLTTLAAPSHAMDGYNPPSTFDRDHPNKLGSATFITIFATFFTCLGLTHEYAPDGKAPYLCCSDVDCSLTPPPPFLVFTTGFFFLMSLYGMYLFVREYRNPTPDTHVDRTTAMYKRYQRGQL